MLKVLLGRVLPELCFGEEVFEEVAGGPLGVERGPAKGDVLEVGVVLAGVLAVELGSLVEEEVLLLGDGLVAQRDREDSKSGCVLCSPSPGHRKETVADGACSNWAGRAARSLWLAMRASTCAGVVPGRGDRGPLFSSRV